MEMRELKALEIAARSRVTFICGTWIVPSATSDRNYVVTLQPDSCQCEDFATRQQPCKHIIAARLVCERDHGGKAPEITTDAVPKRPTYKQNWPLYNLAQQTEGHRFRELLFDLLRGIEEPPQPWTGRRRTPMRTMIFSSALKVFTGLSSRRFACELKDAHERGYLST